MVIAFGLPSTRTTNPMPWKSQSQPQHSRCTKDLNAIIRGGQAEIICRESCGGIAPGPHHRPHPFSQCSDGGRLRFHRRMSLSDRHELSDSVRRLKQVDVHGQPNVKFHRRDLMDESGSRIWEHHRRCCDLRVKPTWCRRARFRSSYVIG